eukprot:g601.t1
MGVPSVSPADLFADAVEALQQTMASWTGSSDPLLTLALPVTLILVSLTSLVFYSCSCARRRRKNGSAGSADAACPGSGLGHGEVADAAGGGVAGTYGKGGKTGLGAAAGGMVASASPSSTSKPRTHGNGGGSAGYATASPTKGLFTKNNAAYHNGKSFRLRRPGSVALDDKPRIEGELQKLSSSFPPRWQSRWFRLTPDCYLQHHKKGSIGSTRLKLLGAFDMGRATSTKVVDKGSHAMREIVVSFSGKVRAGGQRTLRLMGTSATVIQGWGKALDAARDEADGIRAVGGGMPLGVNMNGGEDNALAVEEKEDEAAAALRKRREEEDAEDAEDDLEDQAAAHWKGKTDPYWQDFMDQMNHGTSLLFVNKYADAEEVFKKGMEWSDGRARSKPGERDLRSAFALEWALVSVVKGMASLSNDQLDECLARLWTCDALAQKAEAWVGRKVVRGICVLQAGMIQLMQHSFVKGVVNVLRSWQWIKCLKKEALNFQGQEHYAVRSASLLIIGSAQIIISLLPPTMLKLASWFSGFEGDRADGLAMLETCYREGGMLAPFAASTWAAYQLDTKTFLGERQTADDFKRCRRLFRWAARRYPNSILFGIMEADLYGCAERDVVKARELLEHLAPHVGDELKAIHSVVDYKKALYLLADLRFEDAAECFKSSMQVYIDVGRRSMVPFMAMYATLSYKFAATMHDLESPERAANEEAARGMIDVVLRSRALNKKKWGRQDQWAFRMLAQFGGDGGGGGGGGGDDMSDGSATGAGAGGRPSSSGSLSGRGRSNNGLEPMPPRLELIEAMVNRMRCTRWMKPARIEALLNLLADEVATQRARGYPYTFDDQARAAMCRCDIYYHDGQLDAAMAACDEGLRLEPRLGPLGKKHGIMPMLHCLRGAMLVERGDLAGARAATRRIPNYGKKYWLHPPVMFKTSVMNKDIDRLMAERNS